MWHDSHMQVRECSRAWVSTCCMHGGDWSRLGLVHKATRGCTTHNISHACTCAALQVPSQYCKVSNKQEGVH